MKEIEAIQMRKDLERLKEYGFTDYSISKYVGIKSNQTVREFYEQQDRMLQDKNHVALKDWIEETIQTIDNLET
tara:strand:- start:40 stop:261 length:222 start_codon:yes stop_codon:yes gene_type:complete